MDIARPADATLIARSLTDPECFGMIFDRHLDAVYRFFERRLGRDEADALAGEVFRIAFQQRDRYCLERADCRPWLYGIATNLVRRQHRSQARYGRAVGRLAVPVEDGTAELAEIDHRLDAAARWPAVAAAVAALREEERDVVLLVAWEGLGYDEVAAALRIPSGTVRSRLSRARQRLREQLGLIGEQPVEGSEPAAGRTGP